MSSDTSYPTIIEELKLWMKTLKHFGFNAPDFMPEEYSMACRDVWEDLNRIINDSSPTTNMEEKG